jgi:hypothetical protein
MSPIQFSGVNVLRLANRSRQSYDESQVLADQYQKSLPHSASLRLEGKDLTTYMIYGKDLAAVARQGFGFEIPEDVYNATTEQAKADPALDGRVSEAMAKFSAQVSTLGADAFIQKIADYANGLLNTGNKLDAEGKPVIEQFCTGFGALRILPEKK